MTIQHMPLFFLTLFVCCANLATPDGFDNLARSLTTFTETMKQETEQANTPKTLGEAYQADDIDAFKNLLQKTEEIKQATILEENKPKNLMMHLRQKLRNQKALKFLVHLLHSLDYRDSTQMVRKIYKDALTYTFQNDERGLIDTLLEIKAIKNNTIPGAKEQQDTPLHIAAETGNTYAAEQILENSKAESTLLKKGANENLPIHKAAQKCHQDVITTLLTKAGESDVKKKMLETDNKDDFNALQLAVNAKCPQQITESLAPPE